MVSHAQHWFEHFELITADGKRYKFNDDDRCVMTFEGFGMPDISYITQRGPFQNGETVIDYRIEKRIIQILVRQDGCSRWDYWENRSSLIDYLRPNRALLGILQNAQFVITFPDTTKRALNVNTIDGPKFTARSLDRWDEWGYTESLRFIAHDPILYDPTAICKTIAVIQTVNELVFPVTFYNSFRNPSGWQVIFASDLVDETLSITYPGTWPTFPNLVITGPLEVPVITNLSTNEFIKLPYSIVAGEIVTIILQPGAKTIKSSINGNITVSDDSNMTTFHIECNPKVAGGINVFKLSGNKGKSGVTKLDISYFVRYIGI